MRSSPFDVFEPTGQTRPETPVIVEVPHAGLDVPAPFLQMIVAPARAIARDADLYVDALYEEAILEGASMLVARASRYIVDVNRSESDVDSEVVDGARGDLKMLHGLIWRATSDGEPALSRKLTQAELEERMELVWRPYHRTLAAMIERKRARFGVAVVLAAHSMPSVERPIGYDFLNPGSRADVVPGTRGRQSAASSLIDAVEAHAVASGWTVRHDDPYAGGFTTQHYGRPPLGVHVVQVELARRLYLDEATLRPNRRFTQTRDWCRELVSKLGRMASGLPAPAGAGAGQMAQTGPGGGRGEGDEGGGERRASKAKAAPVSST